MAELGGRQGGAGGEGGYFSRRQGRLERIFSLRKIIRVPDDRTHSEDVRVFLSHTGALPPLIQGRCPLRVELVLIQAEEKLRFLLQVYNVSRIDTDQAGASLHPLGLFL